jgi:hypothetical protein
MPSIYTIAKRSYTADLGSLRNTFRANGTTDQPRMNVPSLTESASAIRVCRAMCVRHRQP